MADSKEHENAAGEADCAGADCLRAAGALIYDYQKRRIEQSYGDFRHYNDLYGFFFVLLYPPPDERARFAPRNRLYARIVKNPILKLIFHPDTIRVVNQVAELERMTESMNRRFARALCARGPLPAELDEETYFALCRETTSLQEHEKQFDYAYEAFYFGEMTTKYFKMNLQQMLNMVPKTLIRNSDLIDLATRTYSAFKNHENELERFRLTLHERELDYIGRIFGVKIDKKPFTLE